jgi:hypothetical protein
LGFQSFVCSGVVVPRTLNPKPIILPTCRTLVGGFHAKDGCNALAVLWPVIFEILFGKKFEYCGFIYIYIYIYIRIGSLSFF